MCDITCVCPRAHTQKREKECERVNVDHASSRARSTLSSSTRFARLVCPYPCSPSRPLSRAIRPLFVAVSLRRPGQQTRRTCLHLPTYLSTYRLDESSEGNRSESGSVRIGASSLEEAEIVCDIAVRKLEGVGQTILSRGSKYIFCRHKTHCAFV